MVSGPDPIAITGSALPAAFAAVKPDSDQIRLDVNVQNEVGTVKPVDQPSGVDGQGKSRCEGL